MMRLENGERGLLDLIIPQACTSLGELKQASQEKGKETEISYLI